MNRKEILFENDQNAVQFFKHFLSNGGNKFPQLWKGDFEINYQNLFTNV